MVVPVDAAIAAMRECENLRFYKLQIKSPPLKDDGQGPNVFTTE